MLINFNYSLWDVNQSPKQTPELEINILFVKYRNSPVLLLSPSSSVGTSVGSEKNNYIESSLSCSSDECVLVMGMSL